MAKRFTDTEKWKKVWYRKLKPEYKCFWEYIRDNCNNAGIWEVDFELASFQIGTKLNQTEIEKVFKKQFVKINGSKWFLVDFIEWQYNCSVEGLNPANNAHLSVIRILKKFDIKPLIKGLERAQSAPMYMDKDKDKVKNKEKKQKYGDYQNVLLTDEQYNDLKLQVDDREKWIKVMDEAIEEKGNIWHIKNFYLALIKWYKKEKDNPKIPHPSRGTRRQGVMLTQEQREQYR